jgi:hypothetical protein
LSKVQVIFQSFNYRNNSINHQLLLYYHRLRLNNRNYVLNTCSLFCCAINAACIYINIINVYYGTDGRVQMIAIELSKITLSFTITATQYQQNSVAILSLCVNHVYFKEILFYIPYICLIINSNTLEKILLISLMFFTQYLFRFMPRYFFFE